MLKKSNTIRIKNTTGGTIPANSFGKIKVGSWSATNHFFEVEKPDADNLVFGLVVVIHDEIANGKIGLACYDGVMVVKETSGESIVAGDKVGTDANQWTAIEIADDSYGNNDGQFFVMDTFVDTDTFLIIRPRVRESLVGFTS